PGGGGGSRGSVRPATRGGVVIGTRRARDDRGAPGRRGTGRRQAAGLGLRARRADRIRETVFRDEPPVGERRDVEAGWHAQARNRHAGERGTLAADPLERGIRAVEVEHDWVELRPAHLRPPPWTPRQETPRVPANHGIIARWIPTGGSNR